MQHWPVHGGTALPNQLPPAAWPLPACLQIDAERALLRAALRDPLNQRFMFLSDSCVPLYSAPLVYTQLMLEGRSRVNPCRQGSGSGSAQHQAIQRSACSCSQRPASLTKIRQFCTQLLPATPPPNPCCGHQ